MSTNNGIARAGIKTLKDTLKALDNYTQALTELHFWLYGVAQQSGTLDKIAGTLNLIAEIEAFNQKVRQFLETRAKTSLEVSTLLKHLVNEHSGDLQDSPEIETKN